MTFDVFIGSHQAQQRYWARSFVGWRRFGQARPNDGHWALAELERQAANIGDIVKAVARKHDLDATFMAKPYGLQAGSGMHVHVSVLDQDGNNIFACAPEQPNEKDIRAKLASLLAVAKGQLP